jgi:lipopolysaccharide export LptBFGC system permease protein LptF
MPSDRQRAATEFKRMVRWIVAIAIAMVGLALTYLHLSGGLTVNMVVATVLGVFFSVVLGCGLFAASFFSDKSGHDQSVSDSTRRERDKA